MKGQCYKIKGLNQGRIMTLHTLNLPMPKPHISFLKYSPDQFERSRSLQQGQIKVTPGHSTPIPLNNVPCWMPQSKTIPTQPSKAVLQKLTAIKINDKEATEKKNRYLKIMATCLR